MPLPVPNLDDRTFDQLAAEARALIPRYFPAWTDHNPSDPGITLLELFAHLFESGLYQLNRVPDRTLENFALLTGAPQKKPDDSMETLLRRALAGLQATDARTLTPAEIEQAVTDPKSGLDIARAKVVVETRNRPNVSPAETIVNVVIVPSNAFTAVLTAQIDAARARYWQAQKAKESADSIHALHESLQSLLTLKETFLRVTQARTFAYLRPRCLLTTRLKIAVAGETDISLPSVVVVRSAHFPAARETLQSGIEASIKKFLTEGKDGKGWEFGRSIFRSELYQVIESVPGVAYIRELRLKGSSRFGVGDLADPIRLAEKFKGTETVPAYLWGQLLPEQQEALRLANATRPVTADLQKALVEALNQLLNTQGLYNARVFTSQAFPEAQAPTSEALKRYKDGLPGFNRRLLEDVFPKELTRIPEDADASRGELPLLSPFSLVSLRDENLTVTVVDV